MGFLGLFKEKLSEQDLYSQLESSITQDGEMVYSGELLSRASKNFPNKTAVIFKDKSLTYKELYFRSVLFSKKLIEKGVEPKDKIIMSFENSIEFYIVYFAIWQVGATCVPLNTFLHEKEVSYIVDDCKPRLIVASDSLKDKFMDLGLELLISSDIDFEAPVYEIDFDVYKRDSDENCLLLYTSGTTGVPKGVMLSSRNILTNLLQCSARLGLMVKLKKTESGAYQSDERFFAALPLFHVFAQNACVWFPLLIGGTIVVVPKVDRKEILEGLGHKPTIFFGVPALFGLLCLMKTAPLESVKFFVSGGDAMPDKIRAAFALVYGRKICAGYGLTEASPVISVNIENSATSTSDAGKPLVGIDYQIRDKEGNVVENTVGTLWVRGGNVMLGYYKTQGETDKVLVDGWLNTGDLASIDKYGSLSIIGRSKDLIIHKGFNIYPQEVENVILSHPSVFRVAVVGKEDTISGQVPVAYVALRDQNANIDGVMRKFCMDRLASYKIPKKFIYLDDLPINATGKVDKKRLDRA